MKCKILLATFIIVSSTLGCEKEENSRIECKFYVLNEQGEVKSSFEEGENVIFSLQLKNITNEGLYLHHFKMDLEDFCRLIKVDVNPPVDLGKPWEHLFCELVGGILIGAQETLKFEIPWLYEEGQMYGYIGCPQDSYHAETDTLEAGEYRSSFSSSFHFDDYTSPRKKFSVSFTVF